MPNYKGSCIPMWICEFPDGVPILHSVAPTMKGSYKAARDLLKASSWLQVKARGIRAKRAMLISPDEGPGVKHHEAVETSMAALQTDECAKCERLIFGADLGGYMPTVVRVCCKNIARN